MGAQKLLDQEVIKTTHQQGGAKKDKEREEKRREEKKRSDFLVTVKPVHQIWTKNL